MAAATSPACSGNGATETTGKRVAPGTPIGGERSSVVAAGPPEAINTEKVARLNAIKMSISTPSRETVRAGEAHAGDMGMVSRGR